MYSTTSNRQDPTKVTYYQALADVLGIFWQFHDKRIRSGNISFAAVKTTENASGIRPFDPQQIIDEHSRDTTPYIFSPITEFYLSVTETMDGSFQQFLEGNKIFGTQDHLLRNVAVPEETTRFFDPFVTNKIERAVSLNEKVYPIPEESKEGLGASDLDDLMAYRFGAKIRGGLNSGVSVTTQLKELFGSEFRPLIAITLSKIGLRHFPDAISEIGLLDGSQGYPLLDNSKLGLDRERLKHFEIASSLGCPASMIVSPDTNIFLAERGIDVSRTTMLKDFIKKFPPRVDRHLGNWFRELTPFQRETALIDPGELRIMTGEARRNALEFRAIHGCPYGKERG